ncbi:hypothetical protein I601_3073 [Nocardioides dokdonensis FR1436]|uniref:Uncharacterized protein n=1 Tax=Nocardioides dokdonensis FR1436 TaxID=1300347 RepID=A0A1A9GPS9_9ACTN|nr:hypothetical protein [Nocardioides dokdonensis]ANH39481.1 hypothetical protein I601_3073 [Nocardioides dokdonensis FR1436]
MTEQHPANEAPGTGPRPGPRTGMVAVDDVVASIETLDVRPVGEHPRVFEAAHDALRRALDSDPDVAPARPDEG